MELNTRQSRNKYCLWLQNTQDCPRGLIFSSAMILYTASVFNWMVQSPDWNVTEKSVERCKNLSSQKLTIQSEWAWAI